MKKLSILTLILCMGTAAMSQDVFQENLFTADFILKHKEIIGLSNKQEEKLTLTHNANQSVFTEKKKNLEAATEELNRLLNSEPLEEKKVKAQMDKIMALEAQMKNLQLDNLLALRRELSAEQIKSLKAIKMEAQSSSASEFKSKDGALRIIDTNASGIKPFYVIKNQDENQKYTSLEEINPDQIESITVLKGEKAILEYGTLGKNGVVVIYLKKTKK